MLKLICGGPRSFLCARNGSSIAAKRMLSDGCARVTSLRPPAASVPIRLPSLPCLQPSRIIISEKPAINVNLMLPPLRTSLECVVPPILSRLPIEAPAPVHHTNVPIFAVDRNNWMLHIKRKQMKKHQRKKWFRKHLFQFRKRKQLRNAVKIAKMQSQLQEVRDWGEQFDALAYIKTKLEVARRGGYSVKLDSSDYSRQR